MAHRNVHFFKQQPTIIYHQTNNYNIHQCGGHMGGCGGSLWANPMAFMQLMGMAQYTVSSLFQGIGTDYASFNRYTHPRTLNQQTNQTNTTDTINNLKKVYSDVTWIYESGEFWGAKDGEIIARGKTFDDVSAAMQRYLDKNDKVDTDTDIDTELGTDTEVKDTDVDTELDTDTEVKDTDVDTELGTDTEVKDTDVDTELGTDTEVKDTDIDSVTGKPKYDIEANTTNIETVKTIPYGGPWHYAHYYTDENNQQLSITSSEFSQIVQNLKTEMGEVEGNRGLRTLPKEISINGKTYKLMDQARREALGLRGRSGGADTRYTVKESQTTYSVYETNTEGKRSLLQSGLTLEQANQLKANKETALEK